MVPPKNKKTPTNRYIFHISTVESSLTNYFVELIISYSENTCQ